MKNSVMILCAAIALTGCVGSTAKSGKGDDLTLLVGSYSAADDSALCAYSFNTATGAASRLYAIPVSNASFAAVAPTGIVYAASESDSATSALTALLPLADDSGAEVLARVPVGADSPCYVAVSPDGNFVVTANYGDGTVAVFPINHDGRLGERRQLISFTGSGPVESRQKSSHPHCIAFTPDKRFMLVDDLGTDRIYRFDLRTGGDSLVAQSPESEVAIEPGSGPRHIVFNKKGNCAYLINEISDSVTVLDYDGTDLRPMQYIAADTVGAHGAGDIHLSPDGRKLYASLRLKHDGIATFDVDPESGLLTYLRHTATGKHPRNFTLTPDGEWLLVACRDADAVEVYSVNTENGTLVLAGTIDQPRAVFVKFLP